MVVADPTAVPTEDKLMPTHGPYRSPDEALNSHTTSVATQTAADLVPNSATTIGEHSKLQQRCCKEFTITCSISIISRQKGFKL